MRGATTRARIGRSRAPWPEWMRSSGAPGPICPRYSRMPNGIESCPAPIGWLADPLYSLPGNDLRTEHYARHTMALLLQDASNPYGIVWGDDMRELLIRFGWPAHWARS